MFRFTSAALVLVLGTYLLALQPVAADHGATPDGPYHLYVPIFGEAKVAVYETTNNSLVAEIPVGINPIASVASPDGTKIYLSQLGSGTVIEIDALTNTVTNTVVVGNSPSGITINHAGDTLYVANFANRVDIVDLVSFTVADSIPALLNAPSDVELDPSETRIFVSDQTNKVFVYDIATKVQLAALASGNFTTWLSLNSDGSKLFASSINSSNVTQIDTSTLAIDRVIPVTGGAISSQVSVDDTRLYVANNSAGTFSVVDLTTIAGTVISTIPAGDFPAGGSFLPDGSAFYGVNFSGASISVIDTDSITVAETIPTGVQPAGTPGFAVIRDPNLAVAHWPFNDGFDPTENIASDLDGALMTNTVFARSDLGQPAGAEAPIRDNVDALAFDGINDYVEVPDSPSLDQSGSFTISAWINLASDKMEHTIIAKDLGSNQESNYTFLVFDFSSLNIDRNLSLSVLIDDPSASATAVLANRVECGTRPNGRICSLFGTTSIEPGDWHHVVAAYDADAKTMKLFLDGTLDGEAQLTVPSGNNAVTNDRPVRIGKRDAADQFGTGGLDGKIDDVRIYNRLLSNEEITELATDTGLVARLPFDDGSNPTEDIAGNNDGTLFADAAFVRSDLGEPAGVEAPIRDNVDAIRLGGTGFAEVADDSSVDLGNSFTLSTWVKIENDTKVGHTIISKDVPGSFNNTNFNFLVFNHAPSNVFNNLIFFAGFDDLATSVQSPPPLGNFSNCNEDAGGRSCGVAGQTDLTLGQWHHAAAVYDAVTHEMRVYLDGVLDGFVTVNVPSGVHARLNDETLLVGRRKALSLSNNDGLEGSIDDVKIYSRALSDQEIAELANDTGLVARYPLDDGISPTADVVSGSDGVLQGGAAFAVQDLGGAVDDQAPILLNQDAVQFDGNDDVIVVPDEDNLDLGKSFSLSAWFNLDVDRSEHTLVDKGAPDNSERNFALLVFDQPANNLDRNLLFSMTVGDGAATIQNVIGNYVECAARPFGPTCSMSGTTSIAPGGWHHAGAVYDSLTKTMSVYLDGILDGQAILTVPSGANAVVNFEDFRIGKRGDADLFNAGGTDGRIDDVKLFSRAISALEVETLATDPDGDNIAARLDNCPSIFNPDQTDFDNNGFGDACVPVGTVFGDDVDVGDNFVVGSDTLLLDGVQIGGDATVGSNVTLGEDGNYGDNLVVGDGTQIEFDATVGSDVSLGMDVIAQKSINIEDGVTVGDGSEIKQGATLGEGSEVGAGTSIGKDAVIGSGTIVGDDTTTMNGVTVGDGTVIGSNVTIGKNVTIGINVIIGNDTIIRQGVQIGDAATIGERVLINKDEIVPTGDDVPDDTTI